MYVLGQKACAGCKAGKWGYTGVDSCHFAKVWTFLFWGHSLLGECGKTQNPLFTVKIKKIISERRCLKTRTHFPGAFAIRQGSCDEPQPVSGSTQDLNQEQLCWGKKAKSWPRGHRVAVWQRGQCRQGPQLRTTASHPHWSDCLSTVTPLSLVVP